MDKIKLVFPDISMKQSVLSFKAGFYQVGEHTIPGSYKLDKASSSLKALLSFSHSPVSVQPLFRMLPYSKPFEPGVFKSTNPINSAI